MPLSISKYKLYLYLFFLVFLSTIFNFNLLEILKDKFNLNKINITGISYDEKQLLKKDLDNLKNINIFKLSKEDVLNKTNNFNFIESVYVKKVVPSSININLTKTSIIGKTQINGENLYIGKNGKFINFSQIFQNYDVASVFGKFKIGEYLNLLKILKNEKIDTENIEKYYFYKNKRWDLIFSNGLTLMLPSNKLEESIKIYKKLFDNDNLVSIKIIDLRVNNQIILTNINE